MKEQRKRQKQVEQVCEKYPEIKRLTPLKRTLFNLVYVPKYNILLRMISKCGTTSWMKSTLQKLSHGLGINNYRSLNFRSKRKHFEVTSLAGFREILSGNPYSIVHVRHPFERLASGKDFKIIYE